MKGVILTNPFDNGVTQQRKVLRMTEEFARYNVSVDVFTNDQFFVYIKDGKPQCDLQVDFALFFDKDKYSAQLLENCGIRVFNKSRSLMLCDDKMLTHIELAKQNIPMPDTLSGALCYLANSEIDRRYLEKVIDVLGLPVVVKQCHGSYGEQVYLVRTYEELYNLVCSIKMTAHLFQRFVAESYGKDMRVIVIGGKIACGMLRQNDSDFRSNVEHGGKGVKIDVPKEVAELCEQTARILDLDYCGIDVLLGEKPLICEVNSNAMFYAMEQATGVNVAELYVKHIIERVRQKN